MRRPKAQATRARPKQPSSPGGFKAPSPKFFGYAVGAVSTFFLITAFIKADFSRQTLEQPKAPGTQVQQRVEQISLDLAYEETETAEEIPAAPEMIEPLKVQVRNGDNMSLVFERAGIGPSSVHQLAYESEHGKEFSKILPGNEFSFYFDTSSKLEKIVYELSPLESFEAIKTESGFDTTHIVLEPEVFASVKSGEIQNSFYLDGLNAGLNDNLIMELANIFGWDIDFALEIRQGDQFSVVFEEKYLHGEFLGTGRILAAEFINRGRNIRAVRYENTAGQVSYYTPEGLSMRKAFLRTPLDVFRISSHFNLNRKHPILNTIRAHKGTDYAAPTGTPVKAAGDGKVTFAGVNGGYGNMLKIQHGQTYETRYAHLNSFGRGIRNGTWVQQGQIIGYVGSTGLATGPHLHYEFYVNGAVRNPVTVKLPNGEPISSSELANFKAVTQPMLAMLDVSRDNYVQAAETESANGS